MLEHMPSNYLLMTQPHADSSESLTNCSNVVERYSQGTISYILSKHEIKIFDKWQLLLLLGQQLYAVLSALGLIDTCVRANAR